MDMIERVARAICAKEYEDPNELTNSYPDGPMYPVWKDFEWCAKAAIQALREPTEAMVEAFDTDVDAWISEKIEDPMHLYKVMIDAALKEHEGANG